MGADEYDIGSPRTPSAWPMDAPEWRDLGSIGPGPVDDNVWVEDSGGWSIDDSCAGTPDDDCWGGSTTFAMSCSPDSIAPVCRTATLEHEEQLTELLYRCIRDLHSLQEDLKQDGSFFGREELIVERLESHQHAIETTAWELDLCCSRAHILIELVQSQVEYFDKYELSFMAATILRIPMVSTHVSTNRALCVAVGSFLTEDSFKAPCPVQMHLWCQVVHQLVRTGLPQWVLLQLCRDMVPHLADASISQLFIEVAFSCESQQQVQLLAVITGAILQPGAAPIVVDNAITVLGELVSNCSALGSVVQTENIGGDLLRHALCEACDPTFAMYVLRFQADMLALEESIAGLFFEATLRHLDAVCEILWKGKGRLQLHAARVLSMMLRAPKCEMECSLKLVQVLCNTFLGSRANDMVRNRLLTALGELMRGNFGVHVFTQTTLLADTYATYIQMQPKGHDRCSRAHISTLCSCIINEAFANAESRTAISGVAPWGNMLAHCDVVARECQHISNHEIDKILASTFVH